MKIKKIQLLVLSALVASSTVLGACGKKDKSVETPKPEAPTAEAVKKEDPFGKYAEEVPQTSIRIKTSWMTLDEGEDENNNAWTRYLKDKLNIKLTQLWTAPDWGQPFDEKVNISITTDNLPDSIPVYTTLFYRIANGKKAADLTEAYEKYASDTLRKVAEFNNSVGLKSATFDGKLYGIGSPPSAWDRAFVWVRKDWLTKLNLQAPKTIEDIYAIATAFATQDPNGDGKQDEIGIQLNKGFFNGTSDIKYLFAAYNAYPHLWVEKDGKLERGAIQPEAKEVLKKLADLYKNKVISPEFATKDPYNEGNQDVINGKVGLVFNLSKTSAFGEIGESVKKGAEWECYEMPTVDGGLYKTPSESRVGNFMAASAKNQHPEAVIKMINLSLEVGKANPQFVTDNGLNMSPSGKMVFWCNPSNISNPENDPAKYTNVLAALKSGDGSKLNFIEKEDYDKASEYNKDKTKGDWGYAKYLQDGGAVELALTKYKDSVYLDPAWGPETKSWMESGQDLSNKCIEFYTKAIMTGNVDQEFDNWVNYFNTQGGKDATAEINEWYAANKGK